MKMLEAAKASPQWQAIRKDPEGRGWWYGFGDGSYGLRSPGSARSNRDIPPDPNLKDANDWIPAMDFSCSAYPEVLWESSMAVWESKKLRREVNLLRAYSAYQGMVIESLFITLGIPKNKAVDKTLIKLKKLSEELRQLDTEV